MRSGLASFVPFLALFAACGGGGDSATPGPDGDAGEAGSSDSGDEQATPSIDAGAPDSAIDVAHEAGEPPMPPAAGKDRVLVVYNDAWGDDDGDGVTDSLEVARYYAEKRGVPPDHLLAISGATEPNVPDFATYDSQVAQPIKTKLAALGPTNIDVILLIYGVPMAIGDAAAIDNALVGINQWSAATPISWQPNPYFDNSPTFDPEVGHFDHAKFKFAGNDIYLVSRIDGPRGVAGPLDQIDQALYGERYIGKLKGQMAGTVYVDARFGHDLMKLATDPDVMSGAYYAYDQGDKNMAYAAALSAPSGFAVQFENTGASIGDDGAVWADDASAKTAPNAFLYGGWYNYGRYVDAFAWLPGSIGCDLDSGSLYYWHVRSGDVYWGPSALLRGATCVAGVVSEPYLNGHPRPNILLYYVLKGYGFGEASALSTPSIGWMSINIGDPLYTPLRADKPNVVDTKAPQLAGPAKASAMNGTTYLSFLVDDAGDPEVVEASIEWGPSTSYGTTTTSGEGFFRRHSIALAGTTSGSMYHYRLTLKDPAGNVTVLPDATFTAP